MPISFIIKKLKKKTKQSWEDYHKSNRKYNNWGLLIILNCLLAGVHSHILLTLCNPMNCSPPASSVHGISQARILEWIAVFSSRGSSWHRDRTHISCVSYIAGVFLTTWAIGGNLGGMVNLFTWTSIQVVAPFLSNVEKRKKST